MIHTQLWKPTNPCDTTLPHIMANAFSTLSRRYKAPVLLAALALVSAFLINRNKDNLKQHLQEILDLDSKEQTQQGDSKRKESKSKRIGVNARFFKQMQMLLPIVIPGEERYAVSELGESKAGG